MKFVMCGCAQRWSLDSLRATCGSDADLLFGGGAVEMAEYYVDLADRLMEASAPSADLRLTSRVRALVLVRLEQAMPHREAVRRSMAVLAQPCALRAARRAQCRTVDAIWAAAGDHSEGFTFYSKRVTLAALYDSVLLFWLARGDDMAAVESFLDRRLAEIAGFARIKARVLSRLSR